MDKLGVGDIKKKETVKMYKIFLGNLSEADVKFIFPIEFFFNPPDPSLMDQEYYKVIWE